MLIKTLNNCHLDFEIDDKVLLVKDHLFGFDQNYFSPNLHKAVKHTRQNNLKIIRTGYVFDDRIKSQYSDVTFLYEHTAMGMQGLNCMSNYTYHPEINFKNFVCSFNGSAHVSRKLLVSILERFKFYNPNYCSKNFSYSVDVLDGHLVGYVHDRENFYRKFFIGDNSELFFQSLNSFGHVQFNHKKNIYNLENKLAESFLHIVSETIATSSVPFVTEKFLYSVVTRGLFLSYAQPEWHAHVEKYFGFKRYTKLFDYRFDSVKNPIERLVELMTMISKFSKLSTHDWKDLYQIEQETIEYNYHHYFSQDYLKCLAKYS